MIAVAAAVALATFGVGPVPDAATAKPSAEPPSPSRLLVRGYEFGITLSRVKVRPGDALLQFQNDGEDPHDLRIIREAGGLEKGFNVIEPGEYATLETRLHRQSTYVLWCSLGDHRERGMEARLRVGKRRRDGA